MAALNAFANEAAAEILKSLRAPEFVIPTVALPVGFYSLFALAMPGGQQNATYTLATFGVFAVMAPAIFGFGAGVASERERGWLNVKRASPAPAWAFIAAKLVATLLFASVAVGLVYAVAGFGAGVTLPSATWALLLITQLSAALPFVLIGLALGFTFNANGAIAASNVLFLGFSALGGLWLPVVLFPDAMQRLAAFLPSYHLGELALAVVDAPPGDRSVGGHLAAIAAMTVIFALLAGLAWARRR